MNKHINHIAYFTIKMGSRILSVNSNDGWCFLPYRSVLIPNKYNRQPWDLIRSLLLLCRISVFPLITCRPLVLRFSVYHVLFAFSFPLNGIVKILFVSLPLTLSLSVFVSVSVSRWHKHTHDHHTLIVCINKSRTSLQIVSSIQICGGQCLSAQILVAK